MTEAEDMEAEKKGRDYRVIALIAKSITTALGKVNTINLHSTAEKEAFALRIDRADEATATLRQSFKEMPR